MAVRHVRLLTNELSGGEIVRFWRVAFGVGAALCGDKVGVMTALVLRSSLLGWLLPGFAVIALGCSSEVVGAPGDRQTQAEGFSVTIGEQTSSTAQPAVFSVLFFEEQAPLADLSWEILGEGTNLVVQGPYERFRSGKLEVALGAEGEVASTLMVDGKLVTDGRVKFELADGQLTGAIDELDLSFGGKLVVSCAVPTSPPSSVLEDDPEFSSRACAGVREDGF